MTDEPHPLVRAISVRVSCMLHGRQQIHGAPKVYNLGHGNTYQTTGEAVCHACPDDRWLRLEFAEEDVQQIDNTEYATALLAALEDEIGTPDEEEEVADEVTEVPARQVALPGTTSAGGPSLRRPAL